MSRGSRTAQRRLPRRTSSRLHRLGRHSSEQPLVEFGNAAWHFVPLGNDAYFEASDFPAHPDLPRRLAQFARTYGVTDTDQLLWCLHQAKQRSVEAAKYWPISPAQGAAALRQIADDLEWLDNNAAALVELVSS